MKDRLLKQSIAGNKTETRRIITPQPDGYCLESMRLVDGVLTVDFPRHTNDRTTWKPAFLPGDIFYVKEAHKLEQAKVLYRIDGAKGPWKSPLFMRKEYARFFFEVKHVAVEPIQAITPGAILREGVGTKDMSDTELFTAFQALWDDINGARGYWFASNPLVFVYQYERVNHGD